MCTIDAFLKTVNDLKVIQNKFISSINCLSENFFSLIKK